MSELALEVTCQEVKACLDREDDFLLLDCREPSEHETVSIEAARLIPMSELSSRVAELEPNREQTIVVHCHHGMRSAQVAAWLRSQGFPNVQSMAGGIDQWAVEIEPGMARY